jgi:S-adenosylmethionine hydrolase
VALGIPDRASATFHGRDLFAPVAARLATGVPLEVFGVPVRDPAVLPEAFATSAGDRRLGRVAVVDHFGNAITTVRVTDLGGHPLAGAVWEGGAAAETVRTYAEIGDRLAVLVGSSGHIEIAARGSSAVAAGAPGWGAEVQVSVNAATVIDAGGAAVYIG